MSKERTGVSLDRDVYQTAKTREDVNLSGLVNDLLRTYFEAGGSQRELFGAEQTAALRHDARELARRVLDRA